MPFISVCSSLPHSARFHPHWARSHPYSARSHPQHSRLDLIHTRLDLIHTQLDLIHTQLDCIHTRLDLIHTQLDLIHTRLDLILTLLDLIHTRLDLICTLLDLIHNIAHPQHSSSTTRQHFIHFFRESFPLRGCSSWLSGWGSTLTSLWRTFSRGWKPWTPWPYRNSPTCSSRTAGYPCLSRSRSPQKSCLAI
jgi:hypothetical protein